jgi:hypothetical protein
VSGLQAPDEDDQSTTLIICVEPTLQLEPEPGG